MSTLHSPGKNFFIASLTELARSLDPSRFLRIHVRRSSIFDSIVQLEPLSHGDLSFY